MNYDKRADGMVINGRGTTSIVPLLVSSTMMNQASILDLGPMNSKQASRHKQLYIYNSLKLLLLFVWNKDYGSDDRGGTSCTDKSS
jgi:hypothetical protein